VRWQTKMKYDIFIFSLIFISISSSVIALERPIVISDSGWNSTEALDIVDSLPLEFYKFVDIIEFTSKPITYKEQLAYGYMYSNWDYTHYCYDTKITIYEKFNTQMVLLHELGHVYEYCVLKRDNSTEEFANAFPYNIRTEIANVKNQKI